MLAPFDHGRRELVLGVNYFLIGWLGPLGLHFEWYANPFLLYSWKNIKKNRYSVAATYAVIALILMSQLLLTRKILVNEGGTVADIDNFLIGFWAWYCCGVVLVLAALLGQLRLNNSEK